MTSAQLNQDYGIPGILSFSEPISGFPIIEIENGAAAAKISLYGGHVLSYAPLNQENLLFFSEQAVFKVGKALRGGIPICSPWFGAHPTDASKPSHGVARTSFWEVVSTETTIEGATRVILKLTDNEDTRQVWDYAFELAIAVTVGASLDLELITRNTGDKPFEITQALHTYFRIGDINTVKVLGLNGCDYLDKVADMAQKTQIGEVAIAGEVDRIYENVPGDLLIDDPTLGRKIRIRAQNSTTAIVWNPWVEKAQAMGDLGDEDYKKMICIETANAASEVITIPPQTEYHLRANYTCESP